MAYSHETPHATAESFLQYFIANPEFHTVDKYAATSPGHAANIYRGHSNSSWLLVPSAFRDDVNFGNFTPQPPYSDESPKGRLPYLGSHLHSEVRAVFLFLEYADQHGLTTPLDYATTTSGMQLIHAALMDNKEHDYSELFPSRDFWKSTALAQHHGVPTRLLDWSESPLVACFFAAYGASSFRESSPEKDQKIAVFRFSTYHSSEKDPIKLIRAPAHDNDHLRQQKGVFTLDVEANIHYVNTGRWRRLEDIPNTSKQLERVTLPAAESDELLRLLFDLGVSRYSLMPTLDNAARAYSYINKLYSPPPYDDYTGPPIDAV